RFRAPLRRGVVIRRAAQYLHPFASLRLVHLLQLLVGLLRDSGILARGQALQQGRGVIPLPGEDIRLGEVGAVVFVARAELNRRGQVPDRQLQVSALHVGQAQQVISVGKLRIQADGILQVAFAGFQLFRRQLFATAVA